MIGEQLSQSSKIETLLHQLVEEVQKISGGIKGPRPADPNRTTKAKSVLQELEALRGRALVYPFVGSGAGRGPYVELEDGSVKLDLINGIGINLSGHSHPRVMMAAVRGALQDVIIQGNLEPNMEYLSMGKKLVEMASRKSRIKHFWLTTCGTMANENAIKMARQKNSPARFVMAMEGAFAGRSTMMAEITDNPAYKVGLPEYHEILRVPFYDRRNPKSIERSLQIMKEHISRHEKDIAAFSFEPVQGEGGFNVAPREFFIPLLETCREHHIAIWADEVQTFTRTGEAFAFQTLDIGEYIDICTIAKTAQVGATLFTEEYNPKPGLVAGTFSGGTSALSAGREILDILTNDGYFGPNGKIQKIHREFVAMLERLSAGPCKGMLGEISGLGLMVAITPFDGSREKVNQCLQTLFNNGLIAFSCGKNPMRLRFLLPMVMESADIQVASEIIEKTILEVSRG